MGQQLTKMPSDQHLIERELRAQVEILTEQNRALRDMLKDAMCFAGKCRRDLFRHQQGKTPVDPWREKQAGKLRDQYGIEPS